MKHKYQCHGWPTLVHAKKKVHGQLLSPQVTISHITSRMRPISGESTITTRNILDCIRNEDMRSQGQSLQVMSSEIMHNKDNSHYQIVQALEMSFHVVCDIFKSPCQGPLESKPLGLQKNTKAIRIYLHISQPWHDYLLVIRPRLMTSITT